jgi:Helix-turn-helix domain
MGRPRDEAPAGHLTVREAAELLGVSDTAVRGRIKRGTLSTMPDLVTEGGGEPRYYIPRHEVERALSERGAVARREDTGEVMLNSERLAERLEGKLEEIREQRERHHAEEMEAAGKILGALGEHARRREADRELFREQAETEKEYQERALRAMESDGRRWWVSVALVVLLVVLVVLSAVDLFWM